MKKQNHSSEANILNFGEIGIKDIPRVGGKNASLGEMFSQLSSKGILVPDGFAITSHAYWEFLNHNGLVQPLRNVLHKLDTKTFANLSDVGSKARALMADAVIPDALAAEIIKAHQTFCKRIGYTKTVAVRSSATAEDLPTASFAGQQETYLNVRPENLLQACKSCYLSLFLDRAIKYRVDNGFDHMKVALSIGVQDMIRSDLSASGVLFTLDPDSGFENVVVISGSWGLGENIVKGSVNTDEFLVFKPMLEVADQPVIAHTLGSKLKTMVFSLKRGDDIIHSEDSVMNIDTPAEMRDKLVLSDDEVIQLARWARIIEDHYKGHMDVEWAKDGESGKLFIVQARPETVHRNRDRTIFKQYTLLETSKLLAAGAGLGNRIVSGKARILHSPAEIAHLREGEILVTERTDPDWDPVMKKATAIISDQGGRTSHAAIVARELGVIAVVGTGDGTKKIRDGQDITVSTARGETGIVYEGILKWAVKESDISQIKRPQTKTMLILAHPDEAFRYSFLPNDGVGLMRMEFIVSNAIGIHPMALKHFDEIKDAVVKDKIATFTRQYPRKEEFFVKKLAEATAKIAAAFYPKEVIVRMSDFKSNEYASLLGGKQFEPIEENPMIGFRGASRYYHPLYREAFEMECKAMKYVRDEMGFTNVKLMIPFCRTVIEAKKVLDVMLLCGLQRHVNNMELYVMIEIPSNALQAEEFAKHFDGFSIGSNDLTQLTLGADRDSELLGEIFSPFDPAVMQLITMTLEKAKLTGTHTGLCGQAPSDYPSYAAFLVEHGIDSISFNPDALIPGIENILKAEKRHMIAL